MEIFEKYREIEKTIIKKYKGQYSTHTIDEKTYKKIKDEWYESMKKFNKEYFYGILPMEDFWDVTFHIYPYRIPHFVVWIKGNSYQKGMLKEYFEEKYELIELKRKLGRINGNH